MKKLIVFSLLGACLGGVISCSDENDYEDDRYHDSSIKNMVSITDEKGNRYSPFYENDSSVHFIIGHEVDLTKIRLLALSDSDMILHNDVIAHEAIINMSDFTNPPHLLTKDQKGNQRKKKIVAYDLPVLIVNTPDNKPIISKTERTEGCDVILIDTDNQYYDLGCAGIRGRGNSSWQQEKKPYNIKFEKKVPILGMKASKHWILLANAFYDRTQLHNSVTYEMAKRTDIGWVPDNRYVELILNGQHKGLYGIYEKIRVENQKIELEEFDASSWDGKFNGGYMLETAPIPGDSYNPFLTSFFNKTGYSGRYILGWEIKSPDGYLPQSLYDGIKKDLDYIESLIYNDSILQTGKYRNYYDIESAIDWLLIELAINNDEIARSKNVYVYKKSWNSKLRMGPPWDFDFGTFEKNDNEGTFDYFINCCLYFRKLRFDPVFCKRLKEKWNRYKKIWEEEVPLIIDKKYNQICRSAKRNERMWQWLDPEGAYDDHIKAMKSIFNRHINYLDLRISEIKDTLHIDSYGAIVD